ncbi:MULTISPECIES: carbohydrate ABC transporter permease [Arsenicicoccus]|uniref:carbohydrate ABC transporter permease n=1 Tax=Arsenicicoccus TaxID=267408 RepID=UPI0025794428|nr:MULTISPECIES: sugar ABC transporter permease [Arsenicicoccus]
MSTSAATPTPTPAPGPSGRAGRRWSAARRDNRDGWLLVSPTVIVVVAIVVIPVLWNVVLAFQKLSFLQIRRAGIDGPYTLENFRRVLTSAGFLESMWTTVVYSVGSTAGSIVLGLIAALALRNRFPGRGVVRALMLLPYVAPVVAVAFVWQMMLDTQYGIVNVYGQKLLGWDGPLDFLGREPFALVTVIAFEIWRYFPFAFMFIMARLTAVPREIDEAALVDGATPTQHFWHVLLPQLMSVIALLSVLRVIMTFNKFDDVYLLTGGTAGTDIAAVRVYDYLTGRFDAGGAAAQAVVLSLVMAVFLIVYLRFMARHEGQED